MESSIDAGKELMNRMARKTLPGLGFVSSGAPRTTFGAHKPTASNDCDGGCGGQCLSGCKDECITVSK